MGGKKVRQKAQRRSPRVENDKASKVHKGQMVVEV